MIARFFKCHVESHFKIGGWNSRARKRNGFQHRQSDHLGDVRGTRFPSAKEVDALFSSPRNQSCIGRTPAAGRISYYSHPADLLPQRHYQSARSLAEVNSISCRTKRSWKRYQNGNEHCNCGEIHNLPIPPCMYSSGYRKGFDENGIHTGWAEAGQGLDFSGCRLGENETTSLSTVHDRRC